MICDEHKASFDKYEVDVEEIINLAKQISNSAVKIRDIIPECSSQLLKHIAALSIHLTFFMTDFVAYTGFQKIKDHYKIAEIEKEFLSKCGCDIEKDD